MNCFPWPSFVPYQPSTTTLPLHSFFSTLLTLTSSNQPFTMKRVSGLLAKLIPPPLPSKLCPHHPLHVSSVVVPLTLRKTARERKRLLRRPGTRLPTGKPKDVVVEIKVVSNSKMPRRQMLKLEMQSLNLSVMQVLFPPLNTPSGLQAKHQLTGMLIQVPHHT